MNQQIRIINKTRRMYFNWLIDRVSIDDLHGRSYQHLAYVLYRIIFYWSIDLDENRSADGILLRQEWFDRIEEEADARGEPMPELDLHVIDGPCTVLEMMVAMAARIENDIMQVDEFGDRTPVWMYCMLDNAGLLRFDDWNIREETDKYIQRIVQKILDRQYAPNGCGSFFPLDSPCEDRRKVDLWWQAQHWLAENFPD